MEKRCWNCGEFLDSRARFCNNCGKSTAGELQRSDFLNSENYERKNKKVELQCIGSETHARTDLSGVGTDITGAISDDIDKYLNPDVVLQPMVMRKIDKQRTRGGDFAENYTVKGEEFDFTSTAHATSTYVPQVRGSEQPEEGTLQYYEQQYRRIKVTTDKDGNEKKRDKIVVMMFLMGLLSVFLIWVPAVPIVVSTFALLLGTRSAESSAMKKVSQFINTASILGGIFVLLIYITSGAS